MDKCLCNQIRLRRLELSDAENMLEWMKNPQVYEKMQFNPEGQNIECCKKFIERSWTDTNNLHYAISNLENEYLGTISLKNISKVHKNAELGIVVHPKAMKQGIGSEALKLLSQKAFKEFGLNKIYLYVRKDNVKAVSFYMKNGWKLEGEFRRHLFIRGEFRDILWFSLMAQEK